MSATDSPRPLAEALTQEEFESKLIRSLSGAVSEDVEMSCDENVIHIKEKGSKTLQSSMLLLSRARLDGLVTFESKTNNGNAELTIYVNRELAKRFEEEVLATQVRTKVGEV